MNRAKYNLSSPRKSRSPKPMIRSPAFRKKFEDGMPRINHKAIPFHNFYDIEITNIEIAKQHGLNFWGCVMPQKKKYKIREVHSQEKRQCQTRGETIFMKYMKRRPSLHLTPRSFDFDKQEVSKNYQTITDFRTQIAKQAEEKVEKYTNSQNLLREKGSKTANNFLLTQDDISTINKKSLYEMTPRQLEISIEWKKRFLQIFEKKMKDAQNFEYNFKPYRI